MHDLVISKGLMLGAINPDDIGPDDPTLAIRVPIGLGSLGHVLSRM
ncbi:hypothetical protein [Nocardia sp. NPDC059239]